MQLTLKPIGKGWLNSATHDKIHSYNEKTLFRQLLANITQIELNGSKMTAHFTVTPSTL